MFSKLEIISNMNKLALVGKGISHSKSPEIYRRLISLTIHYDLLDYSNPGDVPSAIDLFKEYDGINITSPYKKHFLDQIEFTKNSRELGAVNCLKKEGNKIIGENTDYLAILDIIKGFQNTYGALEIIILGDGVMSAVTQAALKSLGLAFRILSRKITDNFTHLDLNQCFLKPDLKPILINTCSRDYIFQGKIPKNSLFWDYNYNFSEHSSLIPSKVQQYVDGVEMLERQALYAVAFWSSLSVV